MCEQDISRMRRQLDETNDELAQIARERDILAHENDSLQEQFSKAKQENQVHLFLVSFSPRKCIFLLRLNCSFILQKSSGFGTSRFLPSLHNMPYNF